MHKVLVMAFGLLVSTEAGTQATGNKGCDEVIRSREGPNLIDRFSGMKAKGLCFLRKV
jgi:hypothetical protein